MTLARREWVAMHTPGHTADHLCLFDPAEGVLLSGDHVLPTITPHISGIGTSEDPLAEFFASLDRMTELEGVTIVLPAHGHPFADLAGSRPRRSTATTRSGSTSCATASREIGRSQPSESCHNTSSRRGRGGRWPTARPTPTSSTCASSGGAERRSEDGKLLYEVG